MALNDALQESIAHEARGADNKWGEHNYDTPGEFLEYLDRVMDKEKLSTNDKAHFSEIMQDLLVRVQMPKDIRNKLQDLNSEFKSEVAIEREEINSIFSDID